MEVISEIYQKVLEKIENLMKHGEDMIVQNQAER